MSRDFPDVLDPWKAADGRRSFQGTIPLKRMARLITLLGSDEGEARFKVSFVYDRQKNLLIKLSVDADLTLICQRSMQPYLEPVSRRSVLMVIRDLAQQDKVGGDYEPLLLENGRLELVNVVEDELLLGVPQVPRNPAVKEVYWSTDGQVVAEPGERKERLQRPFAGLAGLLKNDVKE